MSDLSVQADDFLKQNPHLYAHRAKQKKIRIVRVQLENRSEAPLTVALDSARFVTNEQDYEVQAPAQVIRRFTIFSLDFIVWAFIDLNPWIALVNLVVFFSGPIYNRRLKRQLSQLTNEPLFLAPRSKHTALVAFFPVPESDGILALKLGNQDNQSHQDFEQTVRFES